VLSEPEGECVLDLDAAAWLFDAGSDVPVFDDE
jgi:hypothetical protein